MIDEQTEGKADIEQEVDQNPTFFRNQGPAGLLGGLFGGFGRRGPHGGRGHHGRGGPRGPFHGFGPSRGHCQRANGCERGGDAWRLKRAKVVSVPSEVLVGAPGQTLFAKVEFINNTQQPHKPGCSFRGVFTGKAAEVLEEVAVPVDFNVTPFQVHSLSVPLKIKDNAQLTANSGEPHHVATFSFHGPRGWQFGEEFQVKFKVEKQLDEIEFYN